MGHLQTVCPYSVGIGIDHVAAVPANEGSICPVLELDYVATHPSLPAALYVDLEDDLRPTVGDYDGEVLVELGVGRGPEAIAADEGEGVEPV